MNKKRRSFQGGRVQQIPLSITSIVFHQLVWETDVTPAFCDVLAFCTISALDSINLFNFSGGQQSSDYLVIHSLHYSLVSFSYCNPHSFSFSLQLWATKLFVSCHSPSLVNKKKGVYKVKISFSQLFLLVFIRVCS
ncbi:hypothetical protein S83_021639 [Arachis hypogaea]